MQNNLVIVESPAKAKTIEKFLGKDFKVMSSYGHIRDLKKKEISIDLDSLTPFYEIPEEKQRLVSDLKKNAKAAATVWLASDEDREGEAIAWHLCEVLGLDRQNTNRIVFHEITKPAILAAIENPRRLDMNLVNAQQARRVLDRLVGFKLSPVLWRKVKPSLSAGRVQSVAVRLIVEREREIQNFKSEPYYRITAVLLTTDDSGNTAEVKAEIPTRFKSHDEALAVLEMCRDAQFRVSNVTKRPLRRTPAPPFTTSTLQQEAARKLGFTVSQTMMVAQRLYESGQITYMRTDSVNLSGLCINASKQEVTALYGEDYSKERQYHTSSKGAQEAHEAIRPTYMDKHQIEGSQQERRLYELIWKRTVASQMADALIEKTTAEIEITGNAAGSISTVPHFVATGEVVTFDGFLKVYRESTDDDEQAQESELGNLLPAMKEGDKLEYKEIISTERLSQGPQRYTEASLVHKMEELGIGRPSTYAPTISTIQQREYVQKGDKKGEDRLLTIDTLKDGKTTRKNRRETIGADKGKLIPTDVGTVVNDFLMENFPDIMDYNFTATVEKDFDEIAAGEKEWRKVIDRFYVPFHKNIRQTQQNSQRTTGSRLLGVDPASGKNVYAKIGRYGTLVQIGETNADEKPMFASMKKGQSIETITLEEALGRFALPRTLGEFEDKEVTVSIGKFGPYVRHNGKFYSLGKNDDPYEVSLERAIEIIKIKRKAEEEKEEQKKVYPHEIGVQDGDAVVSNIGRFGPYLTYRGENFRLAKDIDPLTLSLDKAMEIINNAGKRKARKK